MKEHLNNNYSQVAKDKKYLSEKIFLNITDPLKPKPEPLIIENTISNELSEELILHFNNSKFKEKSYQGVVDRNLRDCKYVMVSNRQMINIQNSLKNVFYNNKIENLNVDFTFTPSIYMYPPGIGFVPHHDMVTNKEIKNSTKFGHPIIGGDYTLVWFLNSLNENQGGELLFHDFPELRITPKKGKLVIFRVDLIHEVKNIIYGERFSLVSRIFSN